MDENYEPVAKRTRSQTKKLEEEKTIAVYIIKDHFYTKVQFQGSSKHPILIGLDECDILTITHQASATHLNLSTNKFVFKSDAIKIEWDDTVIEFGLERGDHFEIYLK